MGTEAAAKMKVAETAIKAAAFPYMYRNAYGNSKPDEFAGKSDEKK